MTIETDSIVAFFTSSAVPGVVTDINTPGWHTKTGLHYAKGTPSASGTVGCAADFAHARGDGQSDTAELLTIYRTFLKVAAAGKLQELYYSGPGADWCVYRGKFQLWSAVPAATRKAIRAIHHNHVHVAVTRGTFLKWDGPPVVAPNPTPPPPFQEDDVDRYGYRIFPCPTGGYWELELSNGGVANFGGADMFGSLPGVGARVVAPLVGLTPAVQNGCVTGYWIYDIEGHTYAFGAAPQYDGYAAHDGTNGKANWRMPGGVFLGLVQSGGWNVGDPIRYTEIVRVPTEPEYQVHEYKLPA